MKAAGKTCLLLWALLISGCAQGVSVVGEFPAAYPKAAELRSIVVYPFSGRDGEEFTDALVAQLQNASVNGKTQFTVSTPQSLSVRSRNITSATGAAKYGRSLGVQAVYYGSVVNVTIDRNQWQERRQECLKPKGFFKCGQWRQYNVTCYRHTAHYGVAPKAVNVSTGSLVYSNTVTASAEYSYCSDQVAQGNDDQLVTAARDSAATQVRRQVAPFNAAFTVDLKKEAPGLADPENQRFEGAVKFAEAGRMDRACAIWQELAPNDKTSSVAVLYNLGVCAEVVADYKRAVLMYSKADSLLMSPDKQVNTALQRARNLQKGQRLIGS